MATNPELNRDNNQDNSSKAYVLAGLITFAAAFVSMANSAVSITEATFSTSNDIESEIENPSADVWHDINITLLFFIALYAFSIFYQRFTKNFYKINATMQERHQQNQLSEENPLLPGTEQTSTEVQDSEAGEQRVSEIDQQSLNYVIYRKPPRSALENVILATASFAELWLGTIGTDTLFNGIANFFFSSVSMPVKLLLGGASLIFGASNAKIFHSIQKFQNNFYNESALFYQKIDQTSSPYKRKLKRYTAKMLNFAIVFLSLIANESSDYTTFEFAAKLIESVLDWMFKINTEDNQIVGILVSLSLLLPCIIIAASKYPSYKDKLDGAFFYWSGGKVFKSKPSTTDNHPHEGCLSKSADIAKALCSVEFLQFLCSREFISKDNVLTALNKVTYANVLVMNFFKNFLNVYYHSSKFTSSIPSSMIALFLSLVSSILTAALLHKSTDVPETLQQPAPDKTEKTSIISQLQHCLFPQYEEIEELKKTQIEIGGSPFIV